MALSAKAANAVPSSLVLHFKAPAAAAAKELRTSRGRSRRGCKTCRLRRVKCDESRPVCQNCVKAQRVCDYHAIRRFVAVDFQEPQLPSAQMALCISPGTSQERRAFDLFQNSTSIELSGLFAPDFWQQSVLQLGQGSKCLRHAIVAISSIHERFAQGTDMSCQIIRVAKDPQYMFAVKQYNAAIRELYTALANNDCAPEVMLSCCMLFICFESFRGSPSTAMMHLQSGLQAIQAWKKGDLSTRMKLTDPTTRQILGLAARLGPQLTNIDMLDIEDFGATEVDIIQQSGDIFEGLANLSIYDPGDRFNSFEEARDEFNHIVNMELCYFYQINPLYTPTTHDPNKLPNLLKETLFRFNNWASAFEELCADQSRRMTSEDIATRLFLQVQYKFTIILINCIFMPNTEGFSSEEIDAYFLAWTPQFRECLELIEELISLSQQSMKKNSTRRNSTFHPEVGIIAPLFLLGLGARDPYVRRRTMELLKSEKRREGTWDSETCWKVLDFIVTNEKPIVLGYLNKRYKLYEHFVFVGEGS
ncbi:hypothetical protein BP5796_06968 [Coleophoma crateriformis]|uniref:Zn(2)-C6 fungal-type domain-containing protein n=1 Tax=Coleophoma crateriformis TaxID=565419 RepID=A0A3D8RPZ3_9HELO|nr:hypothetical protein BP5796_06968 [Coleophoma crateriformis]